MGRIPETTIQEIRSRLDIVEFVGRYVELKKAGRNWKGRCPFHDEKTPSFNVNPDREIFHCFGCQVGGDAIGFLMRHDGLSFPEAARILAKEVGVEVPEEGGRERGVSEQIHQANALAQALYREALEGEAGAPARAYLEGRGIGPAERERFEIGLAPDAWDAVATKLRESRIPAEIGEQAGLLSKRRSGTGYVDKIRGRITFPIQDVRGRALGFGGRALQAEQQPKYLNTPESPVYKKRRAFYGLPDALEGIRRAGRAVICEGYFDRIAFARAGVREALATCGTALTSEHAAQLLRRTREVVLVFDGDEAGGRAMEKALETLLPHGLRVRAVALPVGQDPHDFLSSEGAEALSALVDKAPDALEVVIRRTLRRGWSTPNEKADVVHHVAPLVARVADPVARVEYARRLADAAGTSQAAVEALVRGERGGSSARSNAVDATAGSAALVERGRSGVEERHLQTLAWLFFKHPQLGTPTTIDRIHELVPDGMWRAIVNRLIDAAADGSLTDDGAVDAFVVERDLDEDARARLRAIVVDDTLADGERPVEQVLSDVLEWFAKRKRNAENEDLLRRMRDPEADAMDLLRERQARLAERRSQIGIGNGHAS